MTQLTPAQVDALNAALGTAHASAKTISHVPFGSYDTIVKESILEGAANVLYLEIVSGPHKGSTIRNRLAHTNEAMGVMKAWELGLTGAISPKPAATIQAILNCEGKPVSVVTTLDTKTDPVTKAVKEYTKVRIRLPRTAAPVAPTAPAVGF